MSIGGDVVTVGVVLLGEDVRRPDDVLSALVRRGARPGFGPEESDRCS
jgi:hypothetical protein